MYKAKTHSSKETIGLLTVNHKFVERNAVFAKASI